MLKILNKEIRVHFESIRTGPHTAVLNSPCEVITGRKSQQCNTVCMSVSVKHSPTLQLVACVWAL